MPNILVINFTNYLFSTSWQFKNISKINMLVVPIGLEEDFTDLVLVSNLYPYFVWPTIPHVRKGVWLDVSCHRLIKSHLKYCAHLYGRTILKLEFAGSSCPKDTSCEELASVRTLYNLLPRVLSKTPNRMSLVVVWAITTQKTAFSSADKLSRSLY